MLTSKEQKLLCALEPRAAQEGIEIVTIEIIGAKRAPIIRIYIDADGGVSFDELSSAQAWMGEMLDVIDPFPGAYTMEVSSPGIDRPLRTRAHFERFVGSRANVRTAAPIDGRSNFKGTIEPFRGESLVLTTDNGEVCIPFEAIKRANLIGEIVF
ncbi:ribosome maturation factor RimP [Adlercreutzia sp. ZJ304]|uniref:ribosome maturation factor RimP n=1 Tax=Adlercreutzia sp. ZJ304 TaxID=2709791 RepID=UPI0013EBE00E|nr:ribosome maturation factor RimP [Adlercreutzia sp. ZJ304]